MLLITLLIGATSALSIALVVLVARDARLVARDVRLVARDARLVVRDAPQILSAGILVALAISLGIGCLSLLPISTGSPVLDFALRLASIPSGGLAWWFAWSILDDRFRLDWIKWCGLLMTCTYPLYYAIKATALSVPALHPLLSELGMVPPLLVCGHMLWIAITGFRDDLLAPRRCIRVWIVVAVALGSLISVTAEYLPDGATVRLIKVAVLLAAVLCGMLWLVRMHQEALASEEIVTPQAVQSIEPNIDPRDAAALQRLQTIMENQRPFLDPELTLDSLAVLVGVPAHQLRVIINRGLGQRNFSNYVAKARVECAKTTLADANKARLQILRVAMDAGFPSLATFNRTFKAMEGVTPTEFRAKALENSAQN